MRREQFSLAVTDADWVESDGTPRLPTLEFTYDGDPGTLRERLQRADGTPAVAEDADLAVRLQRSAADGQAEAIVGLAHRLTGDYVFELTADPAAILTFSRAARRYGESTDGGPKYRARVLAGAVELASFEKDTLLVYGPDGELLRQHSLIPSGVEL